MQAVSKAYQFVSASASFPMDHKAAVSAARVSGKSGYLRSTARISLMDVFTSPAANSATHLHPFSESGCTANTATCNHGTGPSSFTAHLFAAAKENAGDRLDAFWKYFAAAS